MKKLKTGSQEWLKSLRKAAIDYFPNPFIN